MKADTQAAGGIEQWGGFVGGHGRFEPMIRLGDIFLVMAWEERGQGKLWKHDQFDTAMMRALHQPDHAFHGDGTGFGPLDRTELGGRDGDGAVGHGGLVSHGTETARRDGRAATVEETMDGARPKERARRPSRPPCFPGISFTAARIG